MPWFNVGSGSRREKSERMQRFQEAVGPLGEAVKGLESRTKFNAADKELPLDLEWAARARCDQAEVLLRLQKAKEAQAIVAGFVTPLRLMVLAWLIVPPPEKSASARKGLTAGPPQLICTPLVVGQALVVALA